MVGFPAVAPGVSSSTNKIFSAKTRDEILPASDVGRGGIEAKILAMFRLPPTRRASTRPGNLPEMIR